MSNKMNAEDTVLNNNKIAQLILAESSNELYAGERAVAKAQARQTEQMLKPQWIQEGREQAITELELIGDEEISEALKSANPRLFKRYKELPIDESDRAIAQAQLEADRAIRGEK